MSVERSPVSLLLVWNFNSSGYRALLINLHSFGIKFWKIIFSLNGEGMLLSVVRFSSNHSAYFRLLSGGRSDLGSILVLKSYNFKIKFDCFSKCNKFSCWQRIHYISTLKQKNDNKANCQFRFQQFQFTCRYWQIFFSCCGEPFQLSILGLKLKKFCPTKRIVKQL